MAALQDPTVKENLTKEGLILKTNTPEELLAMAKTETQMWRKVTEAAHINPE